jgi:hypothetical protein
MKKIALLILGIAAFVGLRRRNRGEALEVDGLTKAELYEKARELEIDGRSQMSKDELAEAVLAQS